MLPCLIRSLLFPLQSIIHIKTVHAGASVVSNPLPGAPDVREPSEDDSIVMEGSNAVKWSEIVTVPSTWDDSNDVPRELDVST